MEAHLGSLPFRALFFFKILLYFKMSLDSILDHVQSLFNTVPLGRTSRKVGTFNPITSVLKIGMKNDFKLSLEDIDHVVSFRCDLGGFPAQIFNQLFNRNA